MRALPRNRVAVVVVLVLSFVVVGPSKPGDEKDDFAFLARFHPHRVVTYERFTDSRTGNVYRSRHTVLWFRALPERVTKVGLASGNPLFPRNGPPTSPRMFQADFYPTDERGFRCAMDVWQHLELPPKAIGHWRWAPYLLGPTFHK